MAHALSYTRSIAVIDILLCLSAGKVRNYGFPTKMEGWRFIILNRLRYINYIMTFVKYQKIFVSKIY